MIECLSNSVDRTKWYTSNGLEKGPHKVLADAPAAIELLYPVVAVMFQEGSLYDVGESFTVLYPRCVGLKTRVGC